MTLLSRNFRYWEKGLVIGDKNTGQTTVGTKYENGNKADFEIQNGSHLGK